MRKIVALCCLAMASSSFAASLEIPMYAVEKVGKGKALGNITAVETPHGILFKPHLKGMKGTPNVRGFHVHVGNSCDNFGLAAQGHLDPKGTNKHLGPYDNQGHLGDIQALIINKNGTVTLPVFAPRLALKDLSGHTLMIHANGDNYADKPAAMGGGGDRVACGVIPGVSAVKATPATKPAAVTSAPAKAVATTPATVTSTVPTPAPSVKPKVAAPTKTKSATSDAASLSTDAQIKELMERKKKLQALQQKSRQQLQTLQNGQPATQ